MVPVHFPHHPRIGAGYWLHSSCTHGFQGLHRGRCVAAHRLHVDIHRRGDVRVTQYPRLKIVRPQQASLLVGKLALVLLQFDQGVFFGDVI